MFIQPEQYQSGLATQVRPRRFSEVVGQRGVVKVLQTAIKNRALPQQLLFTGGSGLGKTTLARVTAAAWLCEAPVEGDSCGQCVSCVELYSVGASHPDVIEFDAASHGLKDQIRDLAEKAMIAPLRSSHKLYIIDEAHGLSTGGGQAFLKLLEEPPPHVIFMLATTDPDKMLQTNRGRCVEFELSYPSHQDLIGHLQKVASNQNWVLDTQTATEIVETTDPALGVRGLLMALVKISGLLHTNPDREVISEVLGNAPPTLLQQCWDHICNFDRSNTFIVLNQLRDYTDDAKIRVGLMRLAYQQMLDISAQTIDPVTVWRHNELVETPAGVGWLDRTLAVLSTPSLSPTTTQGTFEALTQEWWTNILGVVTELQTLFETNQHLLKDVSYHQQPVEDTTDSYGGDPQLDELGFEGHTGDPQQSASTSNQTVEAGRGSSNENMLPTDLLQVFTQKVGKVPAAVVMSCQISGAGNQYVVDVPMSLKSRLEPYVEQMRALAQQFSYELSFV
ncbi:MAG: AAA family ATPase [Acidimicrobiia bacterium]